MIGNSRHENGARGSHDKPPIPGEKSAGRRRDIGTRTAPVQGYIRSIPVRRSLLMHFYLPHIVHRSILCTMTITKLRRSIGMA
jgi:hypothetical protein